MFIVNRGGVWGDWALGDNDCLFRKNGDGTFAELNIGTPLNAVPRAISAGWVDYNNDGFLDRFVANTRSQANHLHRNNGNGNGNHWLLLNLVGPTSNRSAIGAKVVAQLGSGRTGKRLYREVFGRNRVQNDPRVHLGLNDYTSVTELTIQWPSGTLQRLGEVAADQIMTVTEPRRPVLSGSLKDQRSFLLEIMADPDAALADRGFE